ncbi:DUF2798 domain-containing protein [Clostridium sp.]|uniref:DUF2798 domain-containing protein n=1 Tax=Clostridium sp. TaxID=1506 RepID=UPI0028456FB6|nr:DUF2798 domain-containing protein [Clostridium sp.]MDR3598265.1 DUF2798 domain-containing protein [Clostridium sp.]
MGKNKRENFIFTLICCALMVLGMDLYNGILSTGFNSSLFIGILIPYLPIFCIALILDWFLVGKLAKGLVAKIVNDNDPMIKKVLFISFFMVCGMCFCMSLIVSIIHMTTPSQFPIQFAKTLCMNFICALPLQLVIVGPIARSIFFKIYPPINN